MTSGCWVVLCTGVARPPTDTAQTGRGHVRRDHAKASWRIASKQRAPPPRVPTSRRPGVDWRVPKGFLNRYCASNHLVLRRAAELSGAQHGAVDVARGVWGSVDVATFLEACRDVLGVLSPDEEEYVAALASERVPLGSESGRIGDLAYLDKCLQQGRTPTSIKGAWREARGAAGWVLACCACVSDCPTTRVCFNKRVVCRAWAAGGRTGSCGDP